MLLLQTANGFEAVKQYQKKMLRAKIDDGHHKMASYQPVREACTTTLSTEFVLELQKAITSTGRVGKN